MADLADLAVDEIVNFGLLSSETEMEKLTVDATFVGILPQDTVLAFHFLILVNSQSYLSPVI